MPEGKPRMAWKHPGPGLSHDAAHSVAFRGAVTVDGAFRAGGFSLSQGTVVQPRVGVIE